MQQEVIHEPAVQGVIAIGSVAKGIAREDSDIDAVIQEAFIHQHDEPGRNWNMDEWNKYHKERG